MKTSKIIAAAALTILAAAGAQAETYEGVHAPRVGQQPRGSECASRRRRPQRQTPYADGVFSRVARR